MKWTKWLPWRFAVSYIAKKQGILDPIPIMARMQALAQPSEVAEPIELIRSGVVFHARGLINSRTIQHNLDWVWPSWIERQFDPKDPSFIPRAFAITHINISNRNWTAVGYPDGPDLPIVDPNGLLTPIFNGWSLDAWLLTEDGRCLLPSKLKQVDQRQELDDGPHIKTVATGDGLEIHSEAWVERVDGKQVCRLKVSGHSDQAGHLVLALRPYNPEGISFIHDVSLNESRDGWRVNDEHTVQFSEAADRHHVSNYRDGDVHIYLQDREEQQRGHCEVGLSTAAALFEIKANQSKELTASIPLDSKPTTPLIDDAWSAVHSQRCKMSCPDPQWQFLFDAAVTSLVLHSPDDVFPGPYTYKRFWFRDAAYIIDALLSIGLTKRAERALDRFIDRQTAAGYFRSQEGEWDSNGQVLWILERFFKFTNRRPEKWEKIIKRGADWIIKKRVSNDIDAPHAGLMPAGFSAEHLGPNDFYYWDDFWSVAGLNSASRMLAGSDAERSKQYASAARDFEQSIDRSLAGQAKKLRRQAMPASPYRRLDSGAIGSIVCGYPLQLWAADDPRMTDLVEFLLERCFLKGAFYQDMIHSGLNAYLTLHVAQVMMRADDPRFLDLIDAVADIASPTGQWPEAIHPLTGAGCMGDGHHVWASSEWVLMMRYCFMREEADHLVLGQGIPERWLDSEEPISFGPAPTEFGEVTVTVTATDSKETTVTWEANWHGRAPALDIRLPGHTSARIEPGEPLNQMTLRRN
jgi:hypothetical protein